MNKKIIFLDLDGTLLTTDKQIGKRSADALQRALLQGHCVAIASGRSLMGAQMVIEELGLRVPGAFLLAFQGSLIYDCYREEVLLNRSIRPRLVIDLMQELERQGIYAHTYNEHEILTFRNSLELERYTLVTHEPVRILSDYAQLEQERMPKVIAIDYEDHEKLENFQRYYADRPQSREYNSFFSCQEFLEFCRQDSHKGSGLRFLAEHLGIPLSDTVAVGDERNDISMIEAAGVGVAMCNGHREVKDVADYITEHDNNHDGVAEVVERFVL